MRLDGRKTSGPARDGQQVRALGRRDRLTHEDGSQEPCSGQAEHNVAGLAKARRDEKPFVE